MKSDYIKVKTEGYFRCAICDHCEIEWGIRREFVHDKVADEYHCMECAKEIQSTIADNEFEEYDWTEPNIAYWKRPKTGAKKGGENNRPKPVSTIPTFSWDKVEDEGNELVEDEPALS